MRNIWVKLSYYWFLFMLFIVGLLSGGLELKAATIDYNYRQYRVQFYSLSQGTLSWTSWTNFGTSSPLSNGYGVSTLAVRFGYSTKFTNGTTYRFIVESGFSPQATISETFLIINNTSCYGTSTSTWTNDESLITCDFVGALRVTGTNHVKYVFDVTPMANIYGVQFNIGFAGTSEVSSVNTYTKSTITYGEDIGGAINEQTIIITEEITNATTEISNTIIENNEVCETLDKNRIEKDNKFLYNNGTEERTSSSFGISSFVKISSKDKLKVLINVQDDAQMCFYDINKIIISCLTNRTLSVNELLLIPTNSEYFRYSVNKSVNKPILQLCKKGQQAITDALTDSSVDNPSSSISDMEALLPSNGTITQLIALPLNLYQKVLNSINGTCSSFNLGSLYGTNLIMPCIDLSSYLGNSVWSTIDLIMSGVFVLVIARKMIKAFNSFTFMKEGDVIND